MVACQAVYHSSLSNIHFCFHGISLFSLIQSFYTLFNLSFLSENCVPGCIRQKQCTEKNKGLYVEVRFLQLTEVSIPKEVRDKYMNSLVLQEATETEEYRQEYSVVQKNTTAMVY